MSRKSEEGPKRGPLAEEHPLGEESEQIREEGEQETVFDGEEKGVPPPLPPRRGTTTDHIRAVHGLSPNHPGGGEDNPPPPKMPSDGGGDEGEENPSRLQQVREIIRSSWRIMAIIALLMATLIVLWWSIPTDDNKVVETLFVEQSTFLESQAVQDRQIAVNEDNIDQLDGRVDNLEEGMSSLAEMAKRVASSGAESRARPVLDQLARFNQRLVAIESRPPLVVDLGPIEDRIGKLEGEMPEVRDRAMSAYTLSNRHASVLGEHGTRLQKQETRLDEVEGTANKNSARIDDFERKFNELTNTQWQIVKFQCGRSHKWLRSLDVKHGEDVLALFDGDRQAAKKFCEEKFPRK